MMFYWELKCGRWESSDNPGIEGRRTFPTVTAAVNAFVKSYSRGLGYRLVGPSGPLLRVDDDHLYRWDAF
jgi:hypothetical protein